jgi:hypothetical protein
VTPGPQPPPNAGAPVAEHHWQPDNRASRAQNDSTTEAQFGPFSVDELLEWLEGVARWEEKVAAGAFARADACPNTLAGRHEAERHLGQHNLSLSRAACYRDVMEKLDMGGR